MNKSPDNRPPNDDTAAKNKKAERECRLSAALRANLKRRKEKEQAVKRKPAAPQEK